MHYVHVHCTSLHYALCEDVSLASLYVKDANWKHMSHVYYNNNNNVIRDSINDPRPYWKWLTDLSKCDKYPEEFHWTWRHTKLSQAWNVLILVTQTLESTQVYHRVLESFFLTGVVKILLCRGCKNFLSVIYFWKKPKCEIFLVRLRSLIKKISGRLIPYGSRNG